MPYIVVLPVHKIILSHGHEKAQAAPDTKITRVI